MSNDLDILNAIQPGFYDLTNLLDLLVELTKELNSRHPEGRGLEDRVHALAGACVSVLGEVIATAHQVADSNKAAAGVG